MTGSLGDDQCAEQPRRHRPRHRHAELDGQLHQRGRSFARVGDVGVNVRTFTQSLNRGTYLFRVQAFNGTAVSAYANTATVRVK
ncbi:MAG: hypothetical protein ACRD8O_04350 [Bryobacteraceae bacterium]